MKNTILFVLISLSSVVSANNYEKVTLPCTLTGDYTSIEMAKSYWLPYRMDFEVSFVYKFGTRKVVKTDVSDEVLGLPKVKMSKWRDRPYIIKFQNLTTKKSLALLNKLGAGDLPSSLPKGFKFKPLQIRYDSLFHGHQYGHTHTWNGETSSQVHFPKNKLDGLSYHLNVECRKSVKTVL